jgi:VanZ family protein
MIFLGIWFFLVLVVSVLPASGPKTGFQLDKIAHFVLYGVTSVLLFRYLARKTNSRNAFYKAVALASIYGAAMEVMQYFLPYRSFSIGDMAANTAGAFLVCLIYKKSATIKAENK